MIGIGNECSVELGALTLLGAYVGFGAVLGYSGLLWPLLGPPLLRATVLFSRCSENANISQKIFKPFKGVQGNLKNFRKKY